MEKVCVRKRKKEGEDRYRGMGGKEKERKEGDK